MGSRIMAMRIVLLSCLAIMALAAPSKNEVVPEEVSQPAASTSELTQTAAKTTVKAKFFDGRRRWGGDGRRRYGGHWCPSGVSIIPVNAQYATCSAACGNVTTAPPATYATCTQACTSTRTTAATAAALPRLAVATLCTSLRLDVTVILPCRVLSFPPWLGSLSLSTCSTCSIENLWL